MFWHRCWIDDCVYTQNDLTESRMYFTSCQFDLTPNPAPKPTRHWGLDRIKSLLVRSYEFARIIMFACVIHRKPYIFIVDLRRKKVTLCKLNPGFTWGIDYENAYY